MQLFLFVMNKRENLKCFIYFSDKSALAVIIHCFEVSCKLEHIMSEEQK